MKFGVTKNESKNAKEFTYIVWYRASNGSLMSVSAKPTAQIGALIEHFTEEEKVVSLKSTGKQVNEEEFLRQL